MTPSRSEPREPFRFRESRVRAGTSQTIELPVARLLAGSWAYMPVVIFHGIDEGPTIWISGAVHGDELAGVAIIRNLINRLDASQLAGTVLAVPIVNVFGVTIGSRYLPDRRDLNRSFPGSQRGSLASRLAHLFFDTIVSRCVLGIDLHTGSNGRANLPQIRCDLDDPDLARYAHAFGTRILIHASTRDGSLRAAARKEGIDVLLYEAGEAHRIDHTALEAGEAGCLRVMQALGMIREAPDPPGFTPRISRKSAWARAARSGICMTEVELGDQVVEDQKVATIVDNLGRKQSVVRARTAGVIIGLLKTALVHRGDALVHIAEPSS